MKILVLFCTLLLAVIEAPAQQASVTSPTSDWKRYTVRNEDFSITLPVLPAMATNELPRHDVRSRERWLRQLGAYADGIVYTVFIVDGGDPAAALKLSSEGLLPKQEWDPVTEQTVTCDGFTGKQYKSTNPLGGTVQVFATTKRFYRLQAFGATVSDPRVQYFFSSLVLGKNEGIEVSDGPGEPVAPVADAIRTPGQYRLTGRQGERKVLILMRPEPTYTQQAKQHNITGTVVLKAVFSSDGSVTNIKVMSELPDGLTERAVEAAQKIKFMPAEKDGRFVSMYMQLEYNFNLY
jgi:TonB family protein